jgi:hypothetical protein
MSDQQLNPEIKATVKLNTDKKIKHSVIVTFNQQLYLLDDILHEPPINDNSLKKYFEYEKNTYMYPDIMYLSRRFQLAYSLAFQKRSQMQKSDIYCRAIEKEINELLQEYRENKKLFTQDEVLLKHDQLYPYMLAMGIIVISRLSIKNGVL